MVVFLLGRPSVCLGLGLVLVWSFPVLGAGCRSRVPSSLVVGCCPCLPGSGSCAGFREKGRRPKNRSRRSFARAGPFQVFPGMLAVLERRYRGRILTLVHIVVYSPSSQLRRFLARRLHTLSTHRRGPVEEPPRAERALRGGLRFLQCLSRLCFLLPLWRPLSHFTGMFSPRAISEVAKSLDVRVPSPFLLLSPWSKFSHLVPDSRSSRRNMQFLFLSARLPSLMKFQANLSSERSSETLGASLTASTCKYGGSGRLDRRLHQAASGFLRLIFE